MPGDGGGPLMCGDAAGAGLRGEMCLANTKLESFYIDDSTSGFELRGCRRCAAEPPRCAICQGGMQHEGAHGLIWMMAS